MNKAEQGTSSAVLHDEKLWWGFGKKWVNQCDWFGEWDQDLWSLYFGMMYDQRLAKTFKFSKTVNIIFFS